MQNNQTKTEAVMPMEKRLDLFEERIGNKIEMSLLKLATNCLFGLFISLVVMCAIAVKLFAGS